MKTKVTINGVEYNINFKKIKELGLIEEVDARCKSWENFCDKYETKQGFHYDDTTEKVFIHDYPYAINEQLTENEDIAINAFSKLLKLRRDWIGDWEPDWTNGNEPISTIQVYKNELKVYYEHCYSRPFSFPTREMAVNFLNCFRNLFEDCKILF